MGRFLVVHSGLIGSIGLDEDEGRGVFEALHDVETGDPGLAPLGAELFRRRSKAGMVTVNAPNKPCKQTQPRVRMAQPGETDRLRLSVQLSTACTTIKAPTTIAR